MEIGELGTGTAGFLIDQSAVGRRSVLAFFLVALVRCAAAVVEVRRGFLYISWCGGEVH
jgi:hypothetical protein